MKSKLLFLIFLLACLGNIFSQNTGNKMDDYARLAISPFVPTDVGGLNEPAQTALKNRLERIITKNGLSASGYEKRFVLTAKVQKLSTKLVPSTPPVYNYEIEVTFLIGDIVGGTIFSSYSVSISGAGNTESVAEINAIKKIKETSPEYQTFIEEGKKRIIEYYNSKCDFILKEAQSLSGRNEFEAAISTLTTIPETCKECFDKAMDAMVPIYQKQIDRQCKKDMLEANNLWAANQTASGADQASSILYNIDPSSSCYAEANALVNKMAKRVKEIDQREWDFKLKQQQDETQITKDRIKAARDIGVAYGNNQPKTITTYNYRSWWY